MAIREKQLKTTMRYPYIPVRVAKIKNTDNTKTTKDVEKLNVIRSCWEYKMEQLSWKILAFSLKRNHTLSIEPSGLCPWTFIQEK